MTEAKVHYRNPQGIYLAVATCGYYVILTERRERLTMLAVLVTCLNCRRTKAFREVAI